MPPALRVGAVATAILALATVSAFLSFNRKPLAPARTAKMESRAVSRAAPSPELARTETQPAESSGNARAESSKHGAAMRGTTADNTIVQARRSAMKAPAAPSGGTFVSVRPAGVYDGPSENAALVAEIRPGMLINVVNSTGGWLEIRSKHGRPAGFIRDDVVEQAG
jgi:hypothetical protein